MRASKKFKMSKKEYIKGEMKARRTRKMDVTFQETEKGSQYIIKATRPSSPSLVGLKYP